eukprot:3721451-Rhodomonas_salina.3
MPGTDAALLSPRAFDVTPGADTASGCLSTRVLSDLRGDHTVHGDLPMCSHHGPVHGCLIACHVAQVCLPTPCPGLTACNLQSLALLIHFIPPLVERGALPPPLRNQTPMQLVPGMRLLVFDLGVYARDPRFAMPSAHATFPGRCSYENRSGNRRGRCHCIAADPGSVPGVAEAVVRKGKEKEKRIRGGRWCLVSAILGSRTSLCERCVRCRGLRCAVCRIHHSHVPAGGRASN